MNRLERQLPIIEGERVLLRLAKESDIDLIINYYIKNKHHLASFEPVRKSEFYTHEYWQRQIMTNIEEYKNNQSLRLFIFEKEDSDTIIGVVNFNNIVRGVFHACYLGYSLAEDKQGKGYMSEALKASIEYAFNELKLHRIMANYMPHNRKSGSVLKRLGFHVEGYARDYLYINGAWEDHILTSLTNYNL